MYGIVDFPASDSLSRSKIVSLLASVCICIVMYGFPAHQMLTIASAEEIWLDDDKECKMSLSMPELLVIERRKTGRLEVDLCWIISHVFLTTQSVQGLN